MCCACHLGKINRREFIELSAAAVAGVSLVGSEVDSKVNSAGWNPDKALQHYGKSLVVQPMLIYSISTPREKTSWRPWGGLHSEEDVNNEVKRIENDIETLKKAANFPVKFLPIKKINSVESAQKITGLKNYDVPVVYAASGGTSLLEACFSENRNNLIFLRHRSGPIYLWYEIVHNRFLRKGGGGFKLDEYRYPSGMTYQDVVVDEVNELLCKISTIYGLKNFIGQSIVALGGGGGWCFQEAPKVVQEKFKFNIQTVPYEDLEKRIKSARMDSKKIDMAKRYTNQYLSLAHTSLHTDRQYVENAFLLYSIFNDYLNEYQTNAFTIKECMSTVIPMSDTTACLPLSLLNDEGNMAFCESDFNVIPAGILLHYLSRKPVFLNDPTYPHHGIVTVAHCTAPRRMDGENYALAKVVTHFESDYGATPKVELPLGTNISMICPDSVQKKWLGFTGSIEKNPFYDICRSQYDITINGDWKKLLKDHRGFHWMMAVGDYMTEIEYACGKIGVEWTNVSIV